MSKFLLKIFTLSLSRENLQIFASPFLNKSTTKYSIPKNSGYTVSTSTNPTPTIGVKVEVKIELDWRTIVQRVPIIMLQ